MDRRPAWVPIAGGRVSLIEHDALFRRRWQALKAAQIAAHPDAPTGGHKRSVQAQCRFGAWLAKERRWYAALGMAPPDGRRTFDQPVQAALGSRPRTFREIVREALTEALSQSRSLNDAARRLGLSPAWVRGHCKRYEVNWRACLATYQAARAAFYRQAVVEHGSEQAASVRLGVNRQALRRAIGTEPVRERRRGMRTLLMMAVVVASGVCASAQTPVIPVLGVGELVIEVPAGVTQAQAQTYRAYIDARPAQVLTVACALKPGDTAVTLCATPLAALNLTAQHTVAVTAGIVAADGSVEGPQVPLPFALLKVAPPVNPTPAGSLVRPSGS